MQTLRATITTNYVTGEQTITYSLTPEQVVGQMQERGETYTIAQGCCSECPYQPNQANPFPRGQERLLVQRMEQATRPYHGHPECIRGAIIRYQRTCILGYEEPVGIPPVPSFIGCYAHYYSHYHENAYYQALREADLIRWYDVRLLPSLKESGLLIMLPGWDY